MEIKILFIEPKSIVTDEIFPDHDDAQPTKEVFQFDLLFFTIFFICPFALSLNEKWTFRVWLLIKLSNRLLEITKTNKE